MWGGGRGGGRGSAVCRCPFSIHNDCGLAYTGLCKAYIYLCRQGLILNTFWDTVLPTEMGNSSVTYMNQGSAFIIIRP